MREDFYSTPQAALMAQELKKVTLPVCLDKETISTVICHLERLKFFYSQSWTCDKGLDNLIGLLVNSLREGTNELHFGSG